MRNFYLLMLFCLISMSTTAQTAASYTFSQTNGTYTALSGATNIYTPSWDDNVTNGLGIGFTFNHCGTNYTTFNICANGWINFGSSITNTYTPLSSKTHVVAVLGGDLYYSPSGTVTSLLSGSAPNRVLTIQWANVCHFSSSTTGPLNFQIKLYETSNIIELVYGSFSPSSATIYSMHVGINGNATSDYNNRTTTTSWTSTTAGTSNTSTVRQTNTIIPPNGLTFKWCPPAPSISGSSTLCETTSITLTNALGGGTWSSSNTAVATVGSVSGIVAGLTAGTATITYTPVCGAVAIKAVTVLASPAVPTGSSTVCVGETTTWTNTSGTGTWVSSNTAVATVGSSSGIVTGISAGTDTIIFTLSSSGCTSTNTITVNPVPSAITGTTNLCAAATTTLSSSTTGGAWSSSNTSLATVGSSTGLVSGIAAGTVNITYSLPTGCSAISPVTVNPLPATISGSATVCGSLTTTLADASGGGTWSSSNPSLASIGSASGIVTGVDAGSVTITYTLPTGCMTTSAMSVHPFSAITGTPSVCLGFTTSLSNATSGGTWSSGTPAIATISTGGVVSSVSLGTTIVSYSISSTGCVATLPVAVTNPPGSFSLTGGGSYCSGGTGVHIGLGSSDAGIVYQLFSGSVAVGAPVVGTGGSIDFGLQTAAGAYGVIANPGTACSNIMPGTVTVTINPLPGAYPVSGGGTYCSGGSGQHVYLNSSAIGINYLLFVGGSPVGSPIAGTSAALDFGLQTTTGTYTIGATNATTGCINTMAGTVSISTNPLPSSFNVTGGGGYCSGDTGVHVGTSGSQAGISYQLYFAGSISGAPLTGTGSALDFGLKTASGSYSVLATNTTTGCSRNMTGAAVVTVNPLPTTFTVTGGGNFCIGGTGVSVGLNGSTSGVNYQLYRGTTAVGSPMAGTGLSLNFGLQTVAGTYTVGATNSTTGCINAMSGSAVVGTNPLPTSFSVTGGGSYCSGGAGVSVGLSGSETTAVYQLYQSGTLVDAAAGTGSPIDFGLKTASGTYTIVATNVITGCTANMSGSVNISINALPTNTFTVSGTGSYCAGGTGITLGLSGSQTGISYQLIESGSPSGTAVTGTGSAISFGLRTTGGVYSVIATNTSTSCQSIMTGSATITVNPLPNVFSVSGGGAYCTGSTGVHIGLTNSNTGITYQLYNGTTPIGTPIPGAGLFLDFGIFTTTGTYTVVARNTVTNCTSNMSGSAAVSSNPLPATQTVTGGGNYCAGGTGVHIYLSNSATGIDYQLNIAGSPTGAPVAGIGSTLDFGLATLAGAYSVTATNVSTGCTNNMAGSAIVGITPLPAAHTVTGGGSFCSGGSGVPVKLFSSTAGVDYQLYNGTTAVGAPLTGTGFLLNFGSQTSAGTYTVTALDPATTCSRNMTGSAHITVHALPVAYSVTGGGNYCSGTPGVHIGLTGSSTGTSYQLYRGGVASGFPVFGTGGTLDFGLRMTAGTYSVIASNFGTGCATPMTGTTTVGVNPLPANHGVTGGGGYCPGAAGVHIGLDVSDPGIDYQLYLGGTAFGTPVGGTGSALDFGLITTPGSYNVRAVSASTSCANVMSGSASVAVYPLPASFSVTGGGNYCPGTPGVLVGLGGSMLGTSYQLFNGSSAIGSPLSGSGLAINFGMQSLTGGYSVVATDMATSCSANMTGTVVVGISPLPVTYSVTGGGSYCDGGSGVHVGLSNSATGTEYQLYRDGFASGTPVPGSGTPFSFGSQTAAGIYTIMATTTGTSCSSNMSGSAPVSINPVPLTFDVTGGGVYCAGGAGLHIGLGNSQPGNIYQLYNGTSVTGSPLAGSGSSLDFGLQTSSGSYSIVATDAATGCQNNMTGTANISVAPLPSAFATTGGGTYCAGGGGLAIGLANSESVVTYQLYLGTSPTGTPVAGTGSAITFGPQLSSGLYTVTAINTASGCVNNMSGGATIAINAVPAAYPLIGGGSYCSGSSGVHVGLSASDPGISYQLYLGGTMSGTPLIGSGGSLDFGEQTIAGTYTIIGTNTTTSCSSTMSGSALVGINTRPSTYTLTGGGGYCTGGTGVHIGLNGSNLGISYQLYNGTTAVGIPVTGTGGIIDFGSQAAPGTYSVVATNPYTGCDAAMAGSPGIYLNSLPAAFIVSGGGNYCSGAPGVPVGLSGSNTGITYQLYNGTIAVGSPVSGSGASFDFGTFPTGMYTVTATNTATGCSNTMAGSASVNMNALPVPYSVSGGGAFCAGGPGIPVHLGGSNTGITYQLMNGILPVGSPLAGTGGTLNFGLQTTAGTYTVSAVNTATGCGSIMPGSAVVIVNPLPVGYSLTGGGSYCPGSGGVHIGLSHSQTGVMYQLYTSTSIAGSPVTGTGGPIDFGSLTIPGTYTVIAANTGTTCANNMPGFVAVSVNPTVSNSVSIASASGDTLCSGSLTTFTALPVNGGSSPTYQWTVNGVTRGSGSSFGYLPVHGDILGLHMNSSLACPSPAVSVDTRTLTVDEVQTPAVVVTANPGTNICQGSPVNFTATPYYGGAAPSYSWLRNGVEAATTVNYSYTPADGDVVQCIMTSSYHCRLANTGTSPVYNMQVTVPVNPAVLITAYPGLNIYPGQAITFTANVVNGGTSPGYQWLINGTPVAGANTRTFVTGSLVNGDVVSCDVISSGACSGLPGTQSATVHVVGVGVSQVGEEKTDIQVLPNPNRGVFTLKGKIAAGNEAAIEITDMLGHMVYRENLQIINGLADRKITLGDNLANGMYLLILRTADGNKVFHIVVER